MARKRGRDDGEPPSSASPAKKQRPQSQDALKRPSSQLGLNDLAPPAAKKRRSQDASSSGETSGVGSTAKQGPGATSRSGSLPPKTSGATGGRRRRRASVPPSLAPRASPSPPTQRRRRHPKRSASVSPPNPPAQQQRPSRASSVDVGGVARGQVRGVRGLFSQYYSFFGTHQRSVANGAVTQHHFRLRLHGYPRGMQGLERIQWLFRVLREAFSRLLRSVDPGLIGQLFAVHPSFDCRAVFSERVPVGQLSYWSLAEAVDKILQSDASIRIEDIQFILVLCIPQGHPQQPPSIADIGAKSGSSVKAQLAPSLYEWARDKGCLVDPFAIPEKYKPAQYKNMCVPLAIADGVNRLLKQNGGKVTPAIRDYKTTWGCKEAARDIVDRAGVKPKWGPFSVEDIGWFQTAIVAKHNKEFHICVYDTQGAPVRQWGPTTAPTVNLFIHEPEETQEVRQHCCLITSMPAFFGAKGFCDHCKKAITNPARDAHKCSQAGCRLCKSTLCPNRDNTGSAAPKHCETCNITFKSMDCYNQHLKGIKGKKDSKSWCQMQRKCGICFQVTSQAKFDEHPCGQTLCRQCNRRHLPQAPCFVHPAHTGPKFDEDEEEGEGAITAADLLSGDYQELDVDDEDELATSPFGAEEVEEAMARHKRKKKKKPKKMEVWYADAETMVDEKGDHHANLVVLQHPLPGGSFKEEVFKGPTAMKDFTSKCMEKGSPFSHSTIVWHNASKFDAHLWYRELMKRGCPPKVIFKGQAILSMTLKQNGIRCRDSLQFIPGTPLSAFPKMFGLESGPKGDFPHSLNTPQWVQFGQGLCYSEVDEEGTQHFFPPLRYFHPENKRPKALAELQKWHRQQVEEYKDGRKQYVPEQQLLDYCKQDVRILREGFEKYRATWKEQFPDMEPLDYLTFPSFNNAIFRAKYMAPESLCLLPPAGYSHANRRYSKLAMAYVAWLEQKEKLVGMRNARKGFEVKLSGVHVDGFAWSADGSTQHVIEVHGCYWHGHTCQAHREPQQLKAYQRTQINSARLRTLSESGEHPYGPFQYHEVWECEIKQQQEQDPAMKAFFADYIRRFPLEPLRLREALRGGRTNAIKHKVEVDLKAGERLYYLDFTSLYPAVNFSVNGEEWGVGMPDIYIGAEVDKAPALDKWLGFAKVEIRPPRQLQHAVLGQSINGKLLFHLCTACATDGQQGPCEHSEEERLIKGTFFTGELQMALEEGYELEKVEELWNWPEERRTQEMFRSLIKDQYLKKALASGAPDDPQELDALIQEYKDVMKFSDEEIKPSMFQKNPAMRALAKFSLNNIWGFLGKRNDVSQDLISDKVEDLYRLDADTDIEVTAVRMLEGDGGLLHIQYKPKVEPAGRSGNIALAAMTTAYARLALYKVVRRFAKYVIYMDTDSVFLLLPRGVAPPPTSTVLGGLKDEILEDFGEGHAISSFHSLGPKSYTYSVVNLATEEVVKEEMKAKGVSATAQALEVVNPAVMRDIVDSRSEVLVPQFQIRRDVAKLRLFSTYLKKLTGFRSAKRWFIPDDPQLDTLPFGYCV